MMKMRFKLHSTLRRIKAEVYKKCFPRLYQENMSRWERISHDYKCIFIHIPKTGGNSITMALNKLPKKNNTPERSTPSIGKHAKARNVKRALGNDVWEEYFSFAFVRNPWDLMVSSYHWWLQKAYKFGYTADIKEIERMGSFDNFMHSKYGREQINEQTGTLFDWISENDEVIVDFVGRFENFQEDWNKICEHIGVAPTTIPHANKTQRKNYQEYYTPETKQMVHERFKKVIDLYGYEF